MSPESRQQDPQSARLDFRPNRPLVLRESLPNPRQQMERLCESIWRVQNNSKPPIKRLLISVDPSAVENFLRTSSLSRLHIDSATLLAEAPKEALRQPYLAAVLVSGDRQPATKSESIELRLMYSDTVNTALHNLFLRRHYGQRPDRLEIGRRIFITSTSKDKPVIPDILRPTSYDQPETQDLLRLVAGLLPLRYPINE